MAEWLKAHAWKVCVPSKVPWVRIPLSPPKKYNGYDQGIHNFLIRNNFFPGSHLYDNPEGNIATINYYFPNLNFNSNHRLINDHGRPYDVVHQYDRITVANNFDNTVKDVLI